MNRQTLGTAVVGLVAGGLGAIMATTLSTPAAARDGTAAGKPYIVQLAVASAGVGTGINGLYVRSAGILYRLWSDGMVDAVAFYGMPPGNTSGAQWEYLCLQDDSLSPATLCLQSLGVVPEDPAKPSDVNGDGKVDGADLGILLGDWTKRPAAE